MVRGLLEQIGAQAQKIENEKLRAMGQRLKATMEPDVRKRKLGEQAAVLAEKQQELDVSVEPGSLVVSEPLIRDLRHMGCMCFKVVSLGAFIPPPKNVYQFILELSKGKGHCAKARERPHWRIFEGPRQAVNFATLMSRLLHNKRFCCTTKPSVGSQKTVVGEGFAR